MMVVADFFRFLFATCQLTIFSRYGASCMADGAAGEGAGGGGSAGVREGEFSSLVNRRLSSFKLNLSALKTSYSSMIVWLM